MQRQALYLLSALFLLLAIMFFPAKILATPYYEGKIISLIVGANPGGGTDRLGRIIAKHIPKFIPGKPTVIIRNMAGGGGMVPANYLYNVSKPNGLTFGTFNRGLIFSQLLKNKAVKFDMLKFLWLGSAATETTVLAIRSDLPYKTHEDLKTAKEPVIMGTQFPGTNTYDNALLFKEILGLNMKLITGYASSTAILLAIEQKEADGVVLSYSALAPYINRGLVRPFIRTKASVPEIEKIPVINDLTNDEMNKTLLSMLAVTDFVGRPYTAPPNTPDEIMNILRTAFSKVINDPETIEDGNKVELNMHYLSAEEVFKQYQYFFGQPPDIVSEFSKYIKF